MAKPLKIVLIVIGSFFALLIGGALAATLLFDPNDYSGKITEAVKEQTGRDLTLGNLDLKIFPWLAVGAENVKLGNAAGFGPEPFAEVGSAHVGVRLLPLLLQRKIEISTARISGLKLRLAVDKDGKNNWSDLAKPKEEEQPKPEAGGEDFEMDSLDIGGLKIEDGALSYSDAQAGKTYSLDKLNLKTGNIHVGEPVEIDLDVSIAATAPAAAADISFAGVVDWDLEAQRYGVDPLLLKIKGSGQKMLQGADAKLNAELSGKLAAVMGKQVSFSGLKLKFDGGSDQLKLDGEYGGDLDFDLVSRLLSAPALQLTANAEGKAIPGGKQQVKVSGDLRYDLKQGAMQLSKAKVEAAGLTISTSITGAGLSSDAPKLSGPISIARFSPRELLSKLGQPAIQTADANVLKEASLDAQYSGGFKSAALSDVVLKLDQTTARGRIDVRDFATQAIQFALTVDELDVDRYLAPGADKPAAAGQGKKGSVNDIQLPAAALDALNAEGTLDVGLLKLKGLKINNARVKLAGGRGQIKKQDITAKLYGGTVALNHQFTPGARPKYATKTQLSALNANPFLQDFIGKDWISGLGSISLDLSGGGLTVGDLRKALNGDLGIKIENGAVKGFNLGQIIRKGQAALAGQAAPAETEANKTDFTALSFGAQIVNGILKSDSLNGASPLFRLAGAGEINLIDETINYLAKPTIVESSQGEGGKGLDDLKGLMIPIRLTGNLFSPSYKIDLETALKQKALSKVNEKFEERKDEEKDKLKQKLNDKLNKLFGPKKQAEPAPAPAEPTPPPS